MKSSVIPGLWFLCLCSFMAVPGPLFYQEALRHMQIQSDSLYRGPQNINLLYLGKTALPGYELLIATPDSALSPTSHLAREYDAHAAVNGSFFDMDKGGSVTYLEKGDSLFSSTRTGGEKWAVADSIRNAAIVLHRDSGLLIEGAKPDQVYQLSDKEEFVLVAGPLLLQDARLQGLPDMNFTHHKHPRTCIGITKDSIIFITVDGRSEQAAGMSLKELQEFLLQLGCLDAINLDGGGSTTMWIRDKGIVNEPSDKSGERPVANALILQKNKYLN